MNPQHNPNQTPSTQLQSTPIHQSSPSEQPSAPRHFWQTLKPVISVVGFVVGVVLTATLINMFVFQSYYVEGTSMTPTLQDHDRLIIDKLGRSVANLQGKQYIPNRGQIIVLDSSMHDQNGNVEQLIKRVIGLPGERIKIEGGTVTVYNQASPDGFDVNKSLGLHLAPTFSASSIDLKLGNNEVFVIGDNRAPGGSLDSRSFGPIDTQNIEGRLWARIFPFNTIQIFP